MSLIKDFDDLHIGAKGTVLSIISAAPFFFVVTYLYKPHWIERVDSNPLVDIDFYFILSICICMSLCWFFMNFFVASVTVDLIEWVHGQQNTNDNLERDEDIRPPDEVIQKDLVEAVNDDETLRVTYTMTYIYSVGYLAAAILLNQLWVHFAFKGLVISCFSFLVFRIVWVALWYGLIKRAHK